MYVKPKILSFLSSFWVSSRPSLGGICALLVVHFLATILRNRNVPSPGAIDNTDFAKRPLGDIPAVLATVYLAVPETFFYVLLTVYNAFILFALLGWPRMNAGSLGAQAASVGRFVAIAIIFHKEEQD